MDGTRTRDPAALTDYVRERLNARTAAEPARRSPEPVGRSPELVGRSPELVEGSPELVEGSPEPVGRSPEPVEGSPEPVEGSREAGFRTVLRPRPLLTPPTAPPSSFAPAGLPTPAADLIVAPERDDAIDDERSERAWPVRFTRHHLLVVTIVLAIGALVAGYALTRARAVPVADPVVIESPSPASVPAPTAPATTVPPVRVHVVGEVQQPGVHTLPQGSRVIEAIEAAGGLTPAAKPGALNLAQVLVDGQQVVVGDTEQPSEVRGADGAGGGGASTKVNLNTATQAQLETLPGVGPVTAGKILSWRTEHGRFTRVEELQEVPGIGPKSFAELAPHVTV